MFTNGFVALILGASGGAWVYIQASRRTGGNTRNSAIAGLVMGVVIFILVFTLLGALFKK